MQLRDQQGRLDTLDLFKLVTFPLIGKHPYHQPVLSRIVCSWKLVSVMVQIGRCKMLIYKVTSKWFRTDVQRKPSSGGPAGQGYLQQQC